MPDTWNDLSIKAGWVVLAVSLVVAVRLGRLSAVVIPTCGSPVPEAHSEPVRWAEPANVSVADWTMVQPAGLPRAPRAGRLAERFRLSGTFFEFGPTENRRRNAILEDIQTGVDRILTEGDRIDDIRVVSIFRDRVVLADANGEEELWLRFADGSGHGETAKDGGGEGVADEPGGIPADRFGGRRIGPRRWVFSRDALLDYYQELRDEPERLVKVFDSLEPLYDDVNAITGYRLASKGEPEFFNSVGLRDGDVVRRVNSVPMTNRRRAEFFIGQFVEKGANAFAIEIERGGEDAKLIYEIRD